MFKVSLDSVVISWRGGEERRERQFERDRLIMLSINQSKNPHFGVLIYRHALSRRVATSHTEQLDGQCFNLDVISI